MSEWAPFAIHDPGLNANYRRGRTLRRMNRPHETVGRDSRALIRNRGLAQFLLPKQGPPIQFGPADAVHSDACEFALYGFGVEIERMVYNDGSRDAMTPDQIEGFAQLVAWGWQQHGVPWDAWYLGPFEGLPRLPVGTLYSGWANHGALDQQACDDHHDGVFPLERDLILARVRLILGGDPVPDNDRREFFLVDTYPAAVLSDGSVLTIGHGIGGNNSQVFAHLAGPDGESLTGWHFLGGRIYDSPSVLVDPSGTRVHITGSGDGGDPGAIGTPGNYNVPFRMVYKHDLNIAFAKRFSGWRVMGDAAARIRPAIAPGV